MNAEAAKIISEAREKKGYTQEKMAEMLKVSLRQYNKYESGEFPKFKGGPVKIIDGILGTNAYELIYEQKVPPKISDKTGDNEKGLTMQALVNLTNSNNTLADSNKILAQSHSDLVAMLKVKTGVISNDSQRTQLELLGTVLGIRSLVEELAVKTNKQSLSDVQDSLDKKVKVAMNNIQNKDRIAGDGKTSKMKA